MTKTGPTTKPTPKHFLGPLSLCSSVHHGRLSAQSLPAPSSLGQRFGRNVTNAVGLSIRGMARPVILLAALCLTATTAITPARSPGAKEIAFVLQAEPVPQETIRLFEALAFQYREEGYRTVVLDAEERHIESRRNLLDHYEAQGAIVERCVCPNEPALERGGMRLCFDWRPMAWMSLCLLAVESQTDC